MTAPTVFQAFPLAKDARVRNVRDVRRIMAILFHFPSWFCHFAISQSLELVLVAN